MPTVKESWHRSSLWISDLREFRAPVEDPRERGGRRASLAIHLVTLIAIALLYAVLARSQWFFYDEWNLLAPGSEWHLFAPHNSHLSFSLVLITTLLKGVVGLHAYWPYLAITISIHLVIVHLLWRVMRRLNVQPLISLLLSTTFGVLGAGADNTLWAFQTGFIAPIALGIAAMLLVDGHPSTRKNLAEVAGCLLLAITFSGTALPLIAVVLLMLFCRNGWKDAAFVGVPVVIPYLVWRLIFLGGPQPIDALAARTVGDFFVRVPEYMVTGIVDSVGKMGPAAALAPALLLTLGIWLTWGLRGRSLRSLKTYELLVLGAIVFSLLTALSRLKLGAAEASAGRYVYVYAALGLPAVGVALTRLVRNSRAGVAVIAALLAILATYNSVQLAGSAKAQAVLEQFTRQSMSAAIALADTHHYPSNASPQPEIAPVLTMGDILALHRDGSFAPGTYSTQVMLSTEVNLDLMALPLPGATEPSECTSAIGGEFELPAKGQRIIYLRATKASWVHVTVTRDGVSSIYTEIMLNPGMQKLYGFADATISVAASDPGQVCVPLSEKD